jgi:hypothetical protein
MAPRHAGLQRCILQKDNNMAIIPASRLLRAGAFWSCDVKLHRRDDICFLKVVINSDNHLILSCNRGERAQLWSNDTGAMALVPNYYVLQGSPFFLRDTAHMNDQESPLAIEYTPMGTRRALVAAV